MAANRWKSLDYEPPATGREEGATGRRGDGATGRGERTSVRPEGVAARERRSPAEPWSDRLSGVVAQARSAYLLRNYQAAVDLLERRLGEEPALPGGQRILGQALARLNREPEALERLRAAVGHTAEDWLARASLASLLLRSDDHGPHTPSAPVEAITHLQEALQIEPLPALRELLGAAEWCAGQDA